MSITSRTARAALIPLAAAAIVGAAVSAPAHAAVATEDITASFAKYGAGLDRVVPDANGDRRSAGSIVLDLDAGGNLTTFCLEFQEKTATDAPYHAVSWSQAPRTSKVLGQAAFLAEHHTTLGKAYDSQNWENAATQVAIWELTDPTSVNADTLGNADFAKRVDQLVTAAKSHQDPEPVIDYHLDGSKSVTGTGDQAHNVVAGKVTTAAGTPVAGAAVTFVVNGERTAVETNSSGVATLEVPTSSDDQSVSMEFKATVDPGTVFETNNDKRQSLISAEPLTIVRQATLTLAAAEEPTPTPTPTPVVDPTPTPDPTPSTPPTPVVDPTPDPTPVVDPTIPPPHTPTPHTPAGHHKPGPSVGIPQLLPHTGAGPVTGLVAGAGALGALGLWGLKRFRRK